MLLLLAFSVIGYTAYGQLLPSSDFRPTRPVISPRLCFTRNQQTGNIIQFISDQQTKCMYWQCTAGRPLPRQCGLQTYVSEFYEGDDYNPCTETYTNTDLQFDCTRKGFDPDGNPVCVRVLNEQRVCQNGGEVKTQGNLCWCECPSGFSGSDCSESSLVTDSPPAEASTTSEVDNTIERAESPQSIAESLRRVALRQRKKQFSLDRFQGRQIDQDNTGAIISGPSLQNILLDDVLNVPPSAPVEFSEDNSATEENDVTDRDDDSAAAVPSADTPAVRPSVNRPVARVDASGRFILGDPCPNGFQRDFCAEQNGCLNGGTCVNQCLGATCLCNPPYVAGRRCEQFRCTVDVECMNGGTCSRGRTGISPVATCTCVPGFGGPMCELRVTNNK